ncbi:unnamed protein product [Leptidea sinapis]|uniref:Uncharacterized protein n=1 Tax=Leptidea sinapis TaxID=189913 RepID=A0A5E4PMX6_9NEOP|nr:unnamed protein product [Leptidea sinapis]
MTFGLILLKFEVPSHQSGCKHALELLMWTHRRGEDPTPADVACYWKKSRISGIGTVIKYIEVEKLTNKTSTTPVG